MRTGRTTSKPARRRGRAVGVLIVAVAEQPGRHRGAGGGGRPGLRQGSTWRWEIGRERWWWATSTGTGTQTSRWPTISPRPSRSAWAMAPGTSPRPPTCRAIRPPSTEGIRNRWRSRDFNGDGKADLAVANLDLDSVAIRLGDGAGGLRVAPDVSVGESPRSVAVADFNSDGKADLGGRLTAGIDRAHRRHQRGHPRHPLGRRRRELHPVLPLHRRDRHPVLGGGGRLQPRRQGRRGRGQLRRRTTSRCAWATAPGASRLPPPGVGSRPGSVAVGDFNGDGNPRLRRRQLRRRLRLRSPRRRDRKLHPRRLFQAQCTP